MTTYNEAIADLNRKLAQIDQVLEIGDVNEDMFKELTKLYTNGLILRAQFQASQTMRQRKDSYKNKEADNDKQ